jgi:cobalt-zinc-cadmium efflux system membrane fusion protein
VTPGLTAELSVPAYPELRPTASVRFIAPEIDRETRTARVFLEVDNPDAKLLPGKFVTATLRSPDPNGGGGTGTVVPRAALQSIDGETVVFVQRPDGGFAVRHVRLGSQGSDAAEVVDGLAPGEQVAVSNAFLLKSEVLR